MTGTTTTGPPPTTQIPEEPRPTETKPGPWTGWVLFAGIMLILVGSFQLIAGLVALFEDEYYLVTDNGLIVNVDYTGWGWAHVILAAINITAGFALFTAHTWARIWAIIVAGISAIVNLGFLSAYPVWVTIMVALDVIVIYALAVHWDVMKAARTERHRL